MRYLMPDRYLFLIDLSGSKPPTDELWNEFLVVDPCVTEVFAQFESQIEYVRTTAFDPETQASFDMVLLAPRRDVAAYVGSEKPFPGNARDLARTIAFTAAGIPVTYQLSSAALAGRDIVRIANAPQKVIAVSERFRKALDGAPPADTRHFNFREFSVSGSAERASRNAGGKKVKPARKSASGAPAKRVTRNGP